MLNSYGICHEIHKFMSIHDLPCNIHTYVIVIMLQCRILWNNSWNGCYLFFWLLPNAIALFKHFFACVHNAGLIPVFYTVCTNNFELSKLMQEKIAFSWILKQVSSCFLCIMWAEFWKFHRSYPFLTHEHANNKVTQTGITCRLRYDTGIYHPAKYTLAKHKNNIIDSNTYSKNTFFP